jgi:hypothetical protein
MFPQQPLPNGIIGGIHSTLFDSINDWYGLPFSLYRRDRVNHMVMPWTWWLAVFSTTTE